MKSILSPQGYHASALTDSEATIARLESELSHAASQSHPGDVFLFYYTGHGDQLPDQDPGHRDHDEVDGMDECYCLYDGKWRDDSLYHIWLKFTPGSLIYCITDSCRSGTAMRRIGSDRVTGRRSLRRTHRVQSDTATFIRQQDTFPCPLLHIAASRDATLARGGEDGSELTKNIQRIWNSGTFTGTWEDFYAALSADMPSQPLQANLYGPQSHIVRSISPFSSLPP